jgi:hypothetical protein
MFTSIHTSQVGGCKFHTVAGISNFFISGDVTHQTYDFDPHHTFLTTLVTSCTNTGRRRSGLMPRVWKDTLVELSQTAPAATSTMQWFVIRVFLLT